MAESGVFGNNTQLIWRLPSQSPPSGLVVLAHGCRQSPTVWFSRSAGCERCAPRPEERCLTVRGLLSNYALVAAANIAGSKGCWGAEDVPAVRSAIDEWRQTRGLERTPLFALGPSSGGWFAGQLGRQWADIRAIAMQVMVPLLGDVTSPLPLGTSRPYPPLQMVLMQRDASKLKEAAALLEARWPGRQNAELHTASPRALSPSFFSDGIVGLAPALSAAVHAALVRAGHVDAHTGMVKRHPRRNDWRGVVVEALGSSKGGSKDKERSALLPQGSLQLAMDAIFARLDMAYAYHASTCQFANETFRHFDRRKYIG